MSLATLRGEHTDLSGRLFGRLAPRQHIPVMMANGKRKSLWICVCACGSEVGIWMANLISGNTKSCGCLLKEMLAAKRAFREKYRAEFIVWCGMRGRCNNKNNPSFKDYGGRGILVCDAWLESFETFMKDVGARPAAGLELDRIKNNGNYEPGNVRWATAREQGGNRRNNILLTRNGETMCISHWADRLGISRTLVGGRLKLGWPPEEALTTPKRLLAAERVTVVI